MINMTLNKEKNGIELRFDNKPSVEILTTIKGAGFRWSGKQKMWYAKQSDTTMALANSIVQSEGSFELPEEVKQKNEEADMWQLTRTDGIEDNYSIYRIHDTKEIAARIRKHIKSRFPMCKWSVTKDGNSIYVNLLESPYEIDSDIIKAIVHYAYTYAQSYNYDNSDIMTDYFDVNFYGVYENDIVVSYRYNKREATVAEYNAEKEFMEKKVAYEQAEHEREEREFQERMAQMEIEKAERKKREAERSAKHEVIEDSAEVSDVIFFVIGCDTTNTSKEDTVDGYTDDCNGTYEVKHHRENCKVTRAVYFTKEVYEMFTKQLMDYYSFLEGMGGTATDDFRINSDIDYRMMDAEERKGVESYNNNCVAIYCDGVLKLVINPEGFSYARYVYFVDDKSEIVNEYHTEYGITEEENEKNKELAEELCDVSTDIILENEMIGTWDNERFAEYKQLMKEWIYSSGFAFSIGVVRAIKQDKLKAAMYKLLTEVDGIQDQFARAGFTENQKITIIRIGDFGGLSVQKVYFKSYENGKYAQYDNAVKMVFKPERKRNLYYNWYYREVLIYDGWLDVPDSLLWEEVHSNVPGTTARMSKFLSCDSAQYDVVLEYFKEHGLKPLVNTYKPQF